MEKNYYDILEVNQNASQEIIEKAYKVLVKKYHPDLQNSATEKSKCEEKIKLINEAYEVLSNPSKRDEYNARINQATQSSQATQASQTSHVSHTTQADTTNANINYQRQQEYQKQQEYKRQQEYQRQYNNAINKAYHDAYIQDLKNRGYKIKYKKSFSDYVKSLIALLITIGIVILIFQIPFVKNYFEDLYKDNAVIRTLVDTFVKIFNGK